MESLMNYLSANPPIALALVVLVVLIVFTILKKLIKWALIAVLIAALVLGFSYKNSKSPEFLKTLNIDEKALKKGAEEAIDKIKNSDAVKKGSKELEKTAKKAVKKAQKSIEESLSD